MGDPFKLIIEDDEGHRNVVPVDLGEVTIGRHDNNAIRLNERNVSRQHMRLVKENGHVFAEDLDSYNGVYINGTRVSARAAIHEGDLIRVGDFHLELRGEGLARRSEETTQKTLVPDLDSTHPEIRMADGRAPTGPLSQERTQPGGPAPAPVAAESNTAEPTAIIRLDQIRDLEAKGSAAAITGDKPRLICVSTNLAGREFTITKTEAVIGRTEDNDVQIDHRSVSRHHAKIVTTGSNYKIVDMGSANGTLVNDEQYAELALKTGDLIELGHVKLRFVPPGASYTFTPEERAVIAGKGVAQDDVPTRATGSTKGIMSLVKGNPVGVLGAAVGLVAVLALVIVLTSSGGGDEDAGELDSTVDVPSGGNDASRFVEKAKEFVEKREWRKAEKLLQLGIEKDPSNEPAIDLLSKVEQELKAKKSFDNANRAIKGSNWNAAWNSLMEIPDDSVYNGEAEGLRTQVGGALVTEKANQARTYLREGKKRNAKDLLEEAESIDPDHPEVSGLRRDLSDGEEMADAGEAEPSEDRRGGKKTSATSGSSNGPKPKTTNKKDRDKDKAAIPEREREPDPAPAPTPSPGPAAAAAKGDDGNDAKSLYKKGITLLQGGQNDKAIEALNKCVQVDRGFCMCYRALGIAHARANQGQKAARYYKLYIKYCPTAKDADQVRKMLGDYGDG